MAVPFIDLQRFEDGFLDRWAEKCREISENTRAIRRVVNRILDHLHEFHEQDEDYDPHALEWEDLDNYDDMYY